MPKENKIKVPPHAKAFGEDDGKNILFQALKEAARKYVEQTMPKLDPEFESNIYLFLNEAPITDVISRMVDQLREFHCDIVNERKINVAGLGLISEDMI